MLKLICGAEHNVVASECDPQLLLRRVDVAEELPRLVQSI
jgi:hypothetical protein